jgi:hypothetical protein
MANVNNLRSQSAYKRRATQGFSALSVVEIIAGLGVVVFAVWRLTSSDGVLAGIVPMIVMICVFLVGIALVYMGFESMRDERRRRSGFDDERV